jgi:hypothetical protein
MAPLLRKFFVLTSLVVISACSMSPTDRMKHARLIAEQANMEPISFLTEPFLIKGFGRNIIPDRPVVVYIEGDGFAWIDRYTISPDPTPLDPIGLQLAAIDRSANVIYLARPCHYVLPSEKLACRPPFWTTHRFSDTVIRSYGAILDGLILEHGTTGIHLVGFSGGGAIAVLLAAQRLDVLTVRTVAANLDHISLNQQRRVSPLNGSLDPMQFAVKLKTIPQMHFSGGADKIIPDWVARRFAAAVGTSCAQTFVARGVEHIAGWKAFWLQNFRHLPTC